MPGFVSAQNNTNSPYTRYGYGNLSDNATATQRGMGGIGYGLRNSQLINTMNPASYSNIDSMTFMFDMGLTGRYAWFQEGLNKEKKINGGVEYLAMQFPLAKKLGMGIGIEPVSTVGYAYGETDYLPIDSGLVSYIFQGSGGLSRVYTALSYNFFDKLSLGVKLSYLYGNIMHNNLVSFNSSNNYNTNWNDTLRTYGLTYDLGVQYTFPVGKYKTIVLGGIYSPKIPIGGKVTNAIIRSDPSTGLQMSKEYYATTDSVFELPETYGLGFTYRKLDKVTAGLDILYQRWAEAKFYDQTNAFYDRLKINAGGEYIPNYASNNYLSRVRYRAGLNYTNSYLKVKDAGYKEYGLSVGLGLPMSDRRSFVNLAVEYSLIRPDVSTLIKEQYFKLTVSYTFNERWFVKRKVQ
ncbi:membrane protein [Bacteroidia bacterium]|nr:membrane protein [Bacteroidia bacterium]